MRFLLFVSSLLTLACAASYPNPIAGSANVNCRDPATIYRPENQMYYTFCTGQGMRIMKAPALNGPWKKAGYVMPNNCSKVDIKGRCDLWAGDVAKINGQYVLYYSASQVGSAKAVVGVATSKTMEPGSWTDHGEVLRSTGSLGFIAIDPNIIQANGTLKLSFGSHMSGIFQADLKDIKTLKTKLPGRKLASYNGRPHVEGGFMYKSPDSPYYYFFFSDGITLFGNGRPGKGGEYKVRVGRSKNPNGPFLDKTGDKLTAKMPQSPAGSLALESHGNIYAPGGQSLFRDPVSKRDVIAYHYVKKDKGGSALLGFNYVDFKSGWPKLVEKKVIKPTKPKPKRMDSSDA
ncbi:glycoside hydrolase family 43 protein [Auricularia subglabra TFB-10046 SS5]|uniref:Arabinan endo-1,5-alpha-L-arabinosidase n=1 Tax=Auricularia subglabra (strain TFB-10046 / SS5) TaxID=717982 RepID=J0LGH4_AURST|nr:glycoside hydrolase family 43 protein [Auricularia subglabra TFB-10046 SS5]